MFGAPNRHLDTTQSGYRNKTSVGTSVAYRKKNNLQLYNFLNSRLLVTLSIALYDFQEKLRNISDWRRTSSFLVSKRWREGASGLTEM